MGDVDLVIVVGERYLWELVVLGSRAEEAFLNLGAKRRLDQREDSADHGSADHHVADPMRLALRSYRRAQLAGCVSDPLTGGIACGAHPAVIRETFGGLSEGAGCNLEGVAESLSSLLHRWPSGIARFSGKCNHIVCEVADGFGRAAACRRDVVERGGSGTSTSHAAEPPCSPTEFG